MTENHIQVQHKYVDFQKVSLGQKIRDIYDFILDNCEDNDTSQLTNFNLEEFEYTFDDLTLAQMMHQEDCNRDFYDRDTTQQIVDSQFDKSKNFFQNLFIFYLITFILPIVISGIIQNQLVTQICYTISLISLTFFFVIEIC